MAVPLLIASAAVSAVAAKRQANAQAAAAKYNQRLAGKQANQALDAGNVAASASSRRSRALVARMRNSAAGSGLESSSSLELFAEAAFNAEADKQQAFANRDSAANAKVRQAEQFGFQADSARSGGNFGAAAALFGGAASAYTANSSSKKAE